MTEGRLGAPNEKMRLCPSCRMSIPVLAVKCRFCGEEVGRPRDESRKLSISDLGGEHSTMYAPSSSVMEALEAFRTEEVVSTQGPKEPVKRTLFGKKKAVEGPPRQSQPGDLPDLDENSQALASLSMPSRPKQYAPPDPTWMKKIGYLGAFIAAILILYFGGVQVAAMISEWRKPPAVAPKPNYAREKIAQGAFGDALAEAARVNSEQPTKSNAEILEEVRKDVMKQVRSLLDADPWDISKLDEASRIMAKASLADAAKPIQALKEEVDNELAKYMMVLKEVDADAGTAVFTLNPFKLDPKVESRNVKVKEKDTIAERFVVKQIRKGSVSLVDTVRGGRPLEFLAGKSLR